MFYQGAGCKRLPCTVIAVLMSKPNPNHPTDNLISRRLSDLGNIGYEPTAAVHFSPFSCPIGGTMGHKNGKN